VQIAALRDACRQKPDAVPRFLDVARGAATDARQVQGTGQSLPPLAMQDSGGDRQHKVTRLNGYLRAGDDDGAYDYWRTSQLIEDPAAVAEFGARMVEIGRRRAKDVTQSSADRTTRDQRRSRHETPQSRSDITAADQNPLSARERQGSAQIERLRLALDTRDAGAVAALWPQIKDDPEVSRR
jgi:hypothetical protein